MSTDEPSWPTDDEGATPPPPPPPPPAPSPGMPPVPGTARGEPGASLGVRFGARLLDGLILLLINIVLAAVLPGESGLLVSLIGSVVGLAFYVWFETKSGATPGKSLLNLGVRGADGAAPTTEESVKRNIWLLFQLVPLIGPPASLGAVIAIAVTIATDDENRGLHDRFAGTTVVRTT